MLNGVEVSFSADHPTGAGHFPGNPIIPGAVLLDEVLRAMGVSEQAVLVRSMKFFRPLRPGEGVRVAWEAAGAAVRFECRLAGGDALVASGLVERAA
jgi:3-hydroxymyristoyl/3-hydroxydecanoyl-(acyl carrier protein) dehydratase